MNFALNDEQLAFKQRCRDFARDVIRPAAPVHDADESVPWEVMKAAREQGLSGLEVMQYTASDADGQLGLIHSEEMHWGCAGIALAINGSGLAAAGVAASGTPEQIAEWVPQCLGVGDEIKLGAYGVTEPQAGSDVKSLRTTARRDGDEWVLNGTKVFITNGGIADVNVVVATVDPSLGHRGQASFIVPRDTPGLRMGKKESKLGIRASQTSELVFEDCRIPVEYLLGDGQISDPIELALDESSTAGRPALERQHVQQVLADVATEIDAARLLCQRASWMGRNGVPLAGGQGSMSKLKAGDVTMWATTRLIDLVGPAAASSPLEKWFRDAKIFQLFEGTAQVQRLVISRMQVAEYRERLEEAQAALASAEPAAEPEPALA